MSLQQLLAQHSADISATLSHSENIARDNADRKATSLEEKFQHAKETIEGVGGEIAGLSGAYHLGRNIYKKVQARRAQANQPETNADSSGSSSSRAVDENSGSTPEGSSGGDVEAGGGAKPTPDAGADPEATTMPKVAQPDAPIAPEDTEIVNGLKSELGADHPAVGDYQKIAQIKANQLRDAQAKATPSAEPDSSITAKPAEVAEKPTTGPATGTDPAGGGNVAGAELDSATGGRLEQAQQFKSRLAELGEGGEEGAENGVETGVEQVAKKAGTSLLKKGASTALETAGDVLDFLGPVGEAIGVGTALVGLFTGLAHKDKDQTAQQEPTSGMTGVDTSALKTTLQN